MKTTDKIKRFEQEQKKEKLPEVEPGDRVRVWQRIEDGTEEGRLTPFTGIVIARKHGQELGATITVRGEVKGVAVERIFPLHSPTIEKIEVLARHKVCRSKLYYLRKRKGKKARLKRKE